jgi:hypothetical protein
MRVRLRVAVGVIAMFALAPACSEQVDLAPRAQRQLEDDLEALTAATVAADRSGARTALRELERGVAELASAGQISESRAQQILSAAADVADQLSLLPAPEPTPSPSVESPTSPSPEPTEEGDDGGEPGNGAESGNGNGNGNAYGHDKGDGND